MWQLQEDWRWGEYKEEACLEGRAGELLGWRVQRLFGFSAPQSIGMPALVARVAVGVLEEVVVAELVLVGGVFVVEKPVAVIVVLVEWRVVALVGGEVVGMLVVLFGQGFGVRIVRRPVAQGIVVRALGVLVSVHH